MTGAFGAAVNGATMPVFAVLFSEVIQVSTYVQNTYYISYNIDPATVNSLRLILNLYLITRTVRIYIRVEGQIKGKKVQ